MIGEKTMKMIFLLLFVHLRFIPVRSSTAYVPVGNFPPVIPWGWVSPFEPAKFSNEVKSCQEVCADMYFDCVSFDCDEIQEREQLFSIPTPAPTKQTNSRWNQMLQFFSFGLLGKTSGKTDDIPVYSEKMRNRNSHKCFQSCRRNFRSCFKDCICDRVAKNDTFSLARCYGKSAPMTNPPSLLSVIIFRPQETSSSSYSFNWQNIQ